MLQFINRVHYNCGYLFFFFLNDKCITSKCEEISKMLLQMENFGLNKMKEK